MLYRRRQAGGADSASKPKKPPAGAKVHTVQECPRICAEAASRNADPKSVVAAAGEYALILERFAEMDGMVYVADLLLFSKSLKALAVNLTERDEFGEKTSSIFGARRVLAMAAGPATVEEWTKKMYPFAAWCLWQSRSSELYLGQGSVRYFATHWGLNSNDLIRALVRHSEVHTSYTTFEIHDHEVAINGMLSRASRLGARPSGCQGLDAAQSEAVAHIMASPFSALQGGAGVGKTTTVVELVRQMSGVVQVVCVALTHKARRCVEKRLSDIGLQAQVSTIHAFINTLEGSEGSAPLFVLVDESSMVDVELLGAMAVALREHAPSYQLCFIGDTHQLPPVGRGEFYRQLVDSRVGLSELKICYRTDRADMFAGFQSIRNGSLPPASPNFQTVIVEDDKAVNSAVGKMICDAPGSAQLITWQNKDVFRLNQWVQCALAKTGAVGPDAFKGFYTKDRVVFAGDNTETLTNAMIGIVKSAGPSGLEVSWEDGTTTPFKGQVRGLQLAYCLTVHKSQGSEYNNVIVACYAVDKMMSCLDRRFVYTAVTRAKQNVRLVAPKQIEAFLAKALSPPPLTSVRIPALAK
jgi:hypothetical protein